MPHVSTDPSTGEEAAAPVSKELNALTAIRFWRDFRNLAVHSGGVVSLGFKRKHGALFDLLREPYSDYMGALEVGSRIQFYDDIFRAVATTHYRVAARMRQILEEHSGCRRGHFHAPGPKPDSFHLEGHEAPPPLLLNGDHAESLEWVRSFEKAEEVAVAEESAEGEA